MNAKVDVASVRSDEALKSLTAALQEHIIDGPKGYYQYSETLVPDVWFDAARLVAMLQSADIKVAIAAHMSKQKPDFAD